jgi:hypothetical protein
LGGRCGCHLLDDYVSVSDNSPECQHLLSGWLMVVDHLPGTIDLLGSRVVIELSVGEGS